MLHNKSKIEFFKAKCELKLSLPLIDGISAGFPSPAADFVDDMLDLNDFVVRNEATTYYFRVTGNFLEDIGISKGDYLVIDTSLPAKPNTLNVFDFEGAKTLMFYTKDDDQVYLRPAEQINKAYRVNNELELKHWGRVTWVFLSAENIMHRFKDWLFELNENLARPVLASKPIVDDDLFSGFLLPAEDSLEPVMDLNETIVKDMAATFYGRIKGKSLEGIGLAKGDYLVIDRSLNARENTLNVCITDNLLSLKFFIREENFVLFKPASRAHKIIKVTEDMNAMLWGRITWVFLSADKIWNRLKSRLTENS